MPNRALVIVLGALGIVYIVALVSMLIWYDGDKLVAGTLLSGAVGVLVPSLLSLKQSADNAAAIEKTIKKVDANTDLTVQAVETVETTHKIVNNELSKWKQSVIDQSQKDRLLWEERSKSLIAEALAEGLARGRQEMETSHQDAVTEAARVAQVAAETATEAARVVVDAAATAAAVLVAAAPAQTAETQADGTVVVTAPATIEVKVP